jgi:NAD-dependent deacetylase
VDFAKQGAPKFIVDKKIPPTSYIDNLTIIEHPASIGVKILQEKLATLK